MEIVFIIFLTLLNGFFALAEISLVSVKKTRIDQLASNGNSRAKIVQELLKKPESFLSSVQVGITLIGIISGAYGGLILTDDMIVLLSQFAFLGEYVPLISLIVVIGSITFFTIVIGELVPKTIAFKYSERLALFCAPIIKYFSIFAFPFVKVLSFTTKFILKIFRIKGDQSDHLSEDELKYLLHTAEKQGVLELEETRVHQNLFYFTDQTAKSLMTDRSKVEWIDLQTPTTEISAFLANSVHSKFIVCEGKIDKIIGIITAKTFLENYQKENFNLSMILEKPIQIKHSTSSFKILNLFKKSKQYLAIVKDPTDTFIGIVTLHDLIEAIVGHLPEYDEDLSNNIIKRNDGTFLINGSTLIFELNQYFQKDLTGENIPEYTTVEGFLKITLKDTPKVGSILIYDQNIFEIVDMDGPRIDKILMRDVNSNKKEMETILTE